MDHFKEVDILKGKPLRCSICDNSKFLEYNTKLIVSGPLKIFLDTYMDGKGFICSKCGLKHEFFPDVMKYQENVEHKPPMKLKIKGKQ